VEIVVPVLEKTIQEQIIAEVTRRREEAPRLQAEAEAVWQAAQARFEAQVLGQ